LSSGVSRSLRRSLRRRWSGLVIACAAGVVGADGSGCGASVRRRRAGL
jgi:hypothetical protein